jgi:hypothetical protein
MVYDSNFYKSILRSGYIFLAMNLIGATAAFLVTWHNAAIAKPLVYCMVGVPAVAIALMIPISFRYRAIIKRLEAKERSGT